MDPRSIYPAPRRGNHGSKREEVTVDDARMLYFEKRSLRVDHRKYREAESVTLT